MRWIERLIALRYGISEDAVLNAEAGTSPPERGPDPQRLAELLGHLKVRAASRHPDGLDYGEAAGSEEYRAYRRYAADLRAFDPGTLTSREEQLAFWINLYNGLILDAVVQWRVQRSVRDAPGFFWRAAYIVGGHRFSANDIENGILRANAPHPAIPGAPFRASDPRRALSLTRLDPRVHFALVCASRSCPPVAVYSSDRIDEQLDQATRSFIRGGGVELHASVARVRLSRIFQWYAPDFGGNWLGIGDKRPILRFIAEYLPPIEAGIIQRPWPWDVTFSEYDWSLNGLWPGMVGHAVGNS